MKKSIVLICVMIMFKSSLHAMEILTDYASLTETTFSHIHDQQDVLYQEVALVEQDYSVLFSLSLHQMGKHFGTMSDYDKHVAIKNIPVRFFMSENLLLLLGSVMLLPQELVQKICVFMMDGRIASDLTQEEKNQMQEEIATAGKQLYIDPLEQAFEVYHGIKVKLSDDSKPIGPLYVASQEERDAVMRMKKLWYFMSSEEKKLFDAVDDTFRQTYLQGQEVVVLPYEVCTLHQMITPIVISGGMTLLSFGCLTGVLSLLELTFGIPCAVSCNSGALTTSAVGAGFCGSCMYCGIVIKRLHDTWNLSQRMTL